MTFVSRRWLFAAAGALFCAAGSYAVLSDELRFAAAPARIEVQATPIESFDNRDPTKIRFGALEFRGGLVLTSSHKAFGGISAFHLEPDGSHFLAATDNGSWLRGRIAYKDGKPDGIADAEIAPILGSNGKPIASRGWFDVESLTELGGQFYIGIERVEQIVRLDFRRDGLAARGESIAVPADFKTFVKNKSLECLTAAPANSALAGNLIVITEQSLDAAGNHRSFLLKDGEVGRFSVKRSDDFDATDCTVLPPGDLLLVERRFSPARGVAMRIRRLPVSAIKEGALVDGQILIDADLAYQIDNMEGIAVHRNAQGETVITLVSDDNFSAIQRNLLLQFTLVGE
ncbi:MAG: esterase-like activity of phytase family protein [Hyphomicrobium sp.]|nr:esterase-like activity of phytase family protein [Hyphomicrobium sp.]